MSPAEPHRILIALPSEAPGEAMFEPVFKIAQRKHVPVECVCIEDTRLRDIAGLPQSRIIHAYSRESSPLDETVVRRALRVTSGRARERFEATVTRTSVSWTFQARQTAPLSEAFADAVAGDLVVVPLLRSARNAVQVRGLIDAVIGRVAASLLVLNEAGHPDRSVFAVFDGDRGDLAAACDLAEDFGCPLTVFAAGDDAEAAQSLVQEANAILEEVGRTATVRPVVQRDTDELTEAILATAPGTVVLSRSGKTAERIDIVSLLARSSASLLLRN